MTKSSTPCSQSSVPHTPLTTPHPKTQHNTTRRQRQRQTETERDREEKTKEKKTRQGKMKGKMKEKMKEKMRHGKDWKIDSASWLVNSFLISANYLIFAETVFHFFWIYGQFLMFPELFSCAATVFFSGINSAWVFCGRVFLSVYVEDIKLAGKTENKKPTWKILMKDVDLGEPISFLDHVYLGCTQKEMSDKQRYCRQFCRQLQEYVRIQDLGWGFRKAALFRETWREHFLMVLWHGKSCKEMRRKILRTGEQNNSTVIQSRNSMYWRPSIQGRNRIVLTTLQSINSMHWWPSFQRRKIEIRERIVKSILTNCCDMFCILARIGRLDILWSVNKLARAVTKWTKSCDKRLARLISCIHHTIEYRQYCYVGNTAHQCRLGLFQDSDFAGDLEDSKSTSGGILCTIWMSYVCSNQLDVWETNFSFAKFNRDLDCFKTQILQETLKTQNHYQEGSCVFSEVTRLCQKVGCAKKQTSVSHSSAEDEIISLDAGLRMNGVPALTIWDLVIEVFHSVPNNTDGPKREQRGNPSAIVKPNMHNPIPIKHTNVVPTNIDNIPSNTKNSDSCAMLYVFETMRR